MKLCVSLTEKSVDKCIEYIAETKADMIEIRMDYLEDGERIADIIHFSPIPVIVTNRSELMGGRFRGSEKERIELLSEAISSNADYVDIELDSREESLNRIIEEAFGQQCEIIISKHYFDSSPNIVALMNDVTEMEFLRANFLKVVTTPASITECCRILNLYSMPLEVHNRLIAFAMGEIGKFTRLASLCLGAPFMYVSASDASKAAAGQIDLNRMRELIEVFI